MLRGRGAMIIMRIGVRWGSGAMDDLISNVAAVIIGLAAFAPFVACPIFDIWRHGKDERRNRWPWRLHAVILAVGITGVLWAPWVAVGLVKLYRANMNAVAYVTRPDEVQPVPGKVYRADAKPVEKP